MLVIYISGAVGLMTVMEYSLIQAIVSGVFPFVLADFIKLLAAAYLINRLGKAKILSAAS